MNRHLSKALMTVALATLPLFAAHAKCPDKIPTDPDKLDPADLLQCVAELKEDLAAIQQQLRVSSPGAVLQRGMVIAFDDAAGCHALGDGWEDAGFGGKFLMAADTKAGTKWDYRVAGGQPEITIAPENIPPLYIGFHTHLSGSDVSVSAIDALSFVRPSTEAVLTTSKTPATSISSLPPYVPLYLCKRTK